MVFFSFRKNIGVHIYEVNISTHLCLTLYKLKFEPGHLLSITQALYQRDLVSMDQEIANDFPIEMA